MIIDANGGIIVHLHVQSSARANRVAGRHGEALKLAVTAPPQAGRANQAVVKLLAELFDIPARQIAIVSGHSARRKRLLAKGLDPPSTLRRIDQRWRSRNPNE